MPDNIFMKALLIIVLELLVAVLLGFKSRKALFTVFFLNLLTGPLLNFIFSLSDLGLFIAENPVLLIILQLLIILFEWLLLALILRGSKKKLLLLSVLMNLCSFIVVRLVF
jgi:hypothetical protein